MTLHSASLPSRNPLESEAQIKRFAWKVLRRFRGAGHASLTHDDLVQELWVAWVKANQSFDGQYGVPFAAYLHRVMQNHINDFASKEITQRHSEVIAVSLDKPMSEDGGSIGEIIPDTQDGQDVELEQRNSLEAVLKALSGPAQAFVSMMIDPPEEVQMELRMIEARNSYASSRKIAGALPTMLSERIVFDLLCIESRAQREGILHEIECTIGAIHQ
ncbi:RNA polymerase sigma factor (sigma-70 family) [Ochrobactrum sp. P20RRXII]|nr:sigma factor [Ochrobactrum sp. P20RRXII]NIH77460.1 RNA polymerase sigma factor (sigma-70 family) [Ochrobactrum sp. P20RRXII]